eukprot:1952752-Pyramimonas_sp.AAC.1
MQWTTEQVLHVGIMRRRWRYIASSTQPRSVLRGDLDIPSLVDLVDPGNKDVQDAVMHYLGVCFVNIIILQPSWKTSGLPS